MIQSMTGFGRAEIESEKYSVSVELKSVNHRFKDIRFRSSSIFNQIEQDLRKTLEKKFSRGSFDIYIHFKLKEKSSGTENIDFNKIKSFIGKMKEECGEGVSFQVDPTSFLRSDFQIDQELTKDQHLRELVSTTFEQATNSLLTSRSQEGEKLITVLQKHKSDYETNFKKIQGQTKEIQADIKISLDKKFKEFGADLKVDENRFMQEVIYYLEKMDLDEEINRIELHLKKLETILATRGDQGRKIEFLIQELSRETNTIGSKSNNEDISTAVIEMKSHLEKIREQALNLQ